MQPKHRNYTNLEMDMMRYGWPIHNLPKAARRSSGSAIGEIARRVLR